MTNFNKIIINLKQLLLLVILLGVTSVVLSQPYNNSWINYCTTIKEIIKKTIQTGDGQKLTMIAEGFNEVQECVSSFEYEWSIKIKE